MKRTYWKYKTNTWNGKWLRVVIVTGPIDVNERSVDLSIKIEGNNTSSAQSYHFQLKYEIRVNFWGLKSWAEFYWHNQFKITWAQIYFAVYQCTYILCVLCVWNETISIEYYFWYSVDVWRFAGKKLSKKSIQKLKIKVGNLT